MGDYIPSVEARTSEAAAASCPTINRCTQTAHANVAREVSRFAELSRQQLGRHRIQAGCFPFRFSEDANPPGRFPSSALLYATGFEKVGHFSLAFERERALPLLHTHTAACLQERKTT